MVAPNGNGNGTPGSNGKMQIVLLSLFLPPMIAALLGGITTFSSRLTTHTEKIAVLEAQVHDIRDELIRINVKLDKLLERRQ